jgi:Ras family protein D
MKKNKKIIFFNRKTNLIHRFAKINCPNVEYYTPAETTESYSLKLTVNCKPIRLEIIDTPGKHHACRQNAYKDVDVVIICFYISRPESLDNLERFWIPEMKRNLPNNVPWLLVGIGRDYRHDYNKHVTEHDGKGIGNIYEAEYYFECTGPRMCCNDFNVDIIFETAVKVCLNPELQRKMTGSGVCKKIKL